MAETRQTAPEFVAPLAAGDVDEFALPERLDEAPLVFIFFPGAFTDVCSTELATFDDRLPEFEAAGASLYGVSVDTPFALNEFRDQLGLSFDLISDSNRRVVDAFDLAMDFDHLGIDDVAKRAVLVVDGDGSVVYEWVSDDPGGEPDYDAVLAAVEEA